MPTSLTVSEPLSNSAIVYTSCVQHQTMKFVTAKLYK